MGNSNDIESLKQEIIDLKDKNLIMQQKYMACKKERDEFKKVHKEMEEQMATLQNQMRSMVPCPTNTSQSFPMYNELTNIISEFYKVDCVDIFFDVLSSELNLDGVIYFF